MRMKEDHYWSSFLLKVYNILVKADKDGILDGKEEFKGLYTCIYLGMLVGKHRTFCKAHVRCRVNGGTDELSQDVFSYTCSFCYSTSYRWYNQLKDIEENACGLPA